MRVKVWHLYVVPVLLIGFAIYEYIDLTAWETEGGVRYMGRRTRALYKLGGKWGVVGFTALIAAVWSAALFIYIKYTRRTRKQEAAAQERAAAREVEAAVESRKAAERPVLRARTQPSGPVAAPAIPTLESPEPKPTSGPVPSSGDDEPSILK